MSDSIKIINGDCEMVLASATAEYRLRWDGQRPVLQRMWVIEERGYGGIRHSEWLDVEDSHDPH